MKPALSILLLFLTLAGILSGCTFGGETADDHLLTARKYAAGGYNSAASNELIKALEKKPDHVASILLLDKVTTGVEKYKKMLPYLSRAMQAGVKDYRVINKLIKAHLELNNYKSALIEIQKIKSHSIVSESLNSDQLISLDLLKAEAYVGLGEFTSAENIYNDLVKNPSYLRTAQLGLGRVTIEKINRAYPFHPAYMNTKLPAHQYLFDADSRSIHYRLSRAMREQLINGKDNTRKILEVLPDHPEANLNMAEILYLLGDFSQSIKYINNILATDQKNTRALLLLARSNIGLGYFKAAENNLIKLLAINKNELIAVNTLASLHIRNGKGKDAELLLKPYLKKGLRDEDLFVNLGNIELLNNDPKTALNYFKQAAENFPGSAYAHAQLGTACLQNKQYKLALSEFKEARLNDIGNLEISLSLIQANLLSGEYMAGLRYARTLSGQHPDSPSPKYFSGLIYVSQGKFKRAKREFTRALEITPLYYQARLQLARLSVYEKNIKLAEKLLQEGLNLDPDQVLLTTEYALLLEQKGEYDNARIKLEQLSKKHPFAIQPKIALGQMYLRSGNISRALEIKNALSNLNNAPPVVPLYVTQVYKVLKNTAATVNLYEELYKQFPANPEYNILLGHAYLTIGNFTAARKHLLKAQKTMGKHNFQVLRSLTELELGQNNTDAASEYIKTMLKISPDQVDSYVLYGDLLVKENKLSKAIKIYSRALRTEKSPKIIHKMGLAYLSAGKKKTARNFLKKWSMKFPGKLEISFALIDYYQQTGNIKSALAECKRFLKTHPENLFILTRMAQLYEKSDQNKAWDYARRALSITEESPPVLNTYGRICINRKRYAEGLDALKRAVIASPATPSFQFHLAKGLYSAGKTKYAKKILKSTLESNNLFYERNEAEKLLARLE